MGINLGALFAPLICGFLAQHKLFKAWLSQMGLQPEHSWHWGFAAAGVCMTLGLIQYLANGGRLARVGQRPTIPVQQLLKNAVGGLLFTAATAGVIFGLYRGSDAIKQMIGWGILILLLSGLIYLFGWYLKKGERQAVVVIIILFFFSILFWMAFEQAGSSLNLFADRLTRNTIFGWDYPSSWFQSAGPVMVVTLAPVFSWLWLRLRERQPSSPAKFACGLLFASAGFLVVTYASTLTGHDLVSPLWLIVVYLLLTFGELCLSPVGLSITTKLAPPRLAGLMMGVWFMSISLGNYSAGWVAGFFKAGDQGALVGLFGKVALTTLVGGLILAGLTPSIRKLMGKVH
jgi:POT family proton-dependent oligopeptide transporter